MPKLTKFERATRAVDALTGSEQVALAKYMMAALGGPRLYTSTEVEKLLTDLITGKTEVYQERRTSGVLVPR